MAGEHLPTTAAEHSWSDQQIQLIQRMVARGTTEDEFRLFLYTAQRHGLDPLTKEIWCIVRPAKTRPDGSQTTRELQILTSHQGYMAAARRNYGTDYRPVRSFAVHAKDDFSFDALSGDVQKHVVKAERGELVGAWAVATNGRGDRVSVYMPFGEMAEAVSRNPLWKSRPTQMILKTAEVHVLRRMFPITGLYTQEEMDGDNRVERAAMDTPEPAPQGPNPVLDVEARLVAEEETEPPDTAAAEPLAGPEVIRDLVRQAIERGVFLRSLLKQQLGRDGFEGLTAAEAEVLAALLAQYPVKEGQANG